MNGVQKTLAMVAFAALTACGGGGGDGEDETPAAVVLSPNETTMSAAQGFWSDSALNYVVLLTPNKEVWSFQKFSTYLGFAHGQVTSVSDTQVRFLETWYGSSRTRSSTTENQATISLQSTLKGKTNTVGSSTTMSWTALYEKLFDQTPDPSQFQGIWTGKMGYVMTVTVDASGNYTTSTANCSSSGKITPDSSGKNFFRVSGSYATASNCAYSGRSVKGVAAVDGTGGTPELVFLQLIGDGAYGAATVASK